MNMLLNFLGSTTTAGGAVPQVVSNANPLPVALSGGIGGLAVAGTVADSTAVATQFPVTVGGVDYATGFTHRLNTDANGVLNVNVLTGGGSSVVNQGAGNTANPWTVQGTVAGGIATSGNPVKIGGVFNTVLPTYLTGQTGELQITSKGSLFAVLVTTNGTIIGNLNPSADANSAMTGQTTWSQGAIYNGATWDRQAKPRTANRLPSSAASNNAANIKTTPGTVYSISGNVTLLGSTCYLKFFDGTGVPNPAAATPLYIFPLNVVDAVFSFNLPGNGLYFPTGMGYAIVANPADLDNTAIAAGQITALNVSFL